MLRTIRYIGAVVLGLTTSLQAQIRFKQLPVEKIQERLSQAKDKDSDREQTLKQMLSEAGCKDLAEQKVKWQKLPNVVCTLPGTTDRVIVVGAHFDHVSQGHGVVDNWTGAALLPSLVESITAVPLKHTIVFVGFTAEEAGLVGSKAYIKGLTPEALSKISAMINFDTLGLSPTKVWASHGNTGLAIALGQMARTMNLPLNIVNVDNVGSSDSEPFREKNIPALTIHSVTQDTWKVLHSPRDTMEAVNINDYYATYRLSAAYLVMLDQGLDAASGQNAPALDKPASQ